MAEQVADTEGLEQQPSNGSTPTVQKEAPLRSGQDSDQDYKTRVDELTAQLTTVEEENRRQADNLRSQKIKYAKDADRDEWMKQIATNQDLILRQQGRIAEALASGENEALAEEFAKDQQTVIQGREQRAAQSIASEAETEILGIAEHLKLDPEAAPELETVRVLFRQAGRTGDGIFYKEAVNEALKVQLRMQGLVNTADREEADKERTASASHDNSVGRTSGGGSMSDEQKWDAIGAGKLSMSPNEHRNLGIKLGYI